MVARPTRNARSSRVAREVPYNGLTYMALLAAHVAHELGTPLTNVGLLVASTRNLTDDPRILDKLNRIDAARRECVGIITDVMAIGRLREPEVERTDLCTVAHAALLEAEPFRPREVTTEFVAPPASVRGEVDPLLIQLVLMDLLKNAYQATARGAVTLSVRQEGPDLKLAVTDTGCGMAPEVQKQIFQPFFTTKPAGQGTGLGLTFCKRVVSSHRGTISVWSKPGIGSTFTVILPKKASHASPRRRR